MSKRRETWTSAFTLIELLVVVAIIGLLISILLPSLSRAKKQAKQLVGMTNLRSQGQASFFYAEEHNGWIGGGIQSTPTDAEYSIYALTVVKGLGFDDATKDLFTGQAPHQQRRLRRLLGKISQLQCPENPEPKQISPNNPNPELLQPLDYISSAMPIPYPQAVVAYDRANANAAPAGEGRFRGESIGDDYAGVRKLDKMALVANPAALIFVSEVNTLLSDMEMRYHHFFLTSQLPFGVHPRIATDQRHPGGLNNLFFDGHVDTIAVRAMDPGWPHSIGERLRLFTVPAADVPESEWN